MTNTFEEFRNSQVLFAIGNSPTEAHPVLGYKLKTAANGGVTLIVVNPKETPLSRHADLLVQLKPGTNVALLMGMMNFIYKNDLYERQYIESRTENFSEFVKSLEPFTPEFVEETTGVAWSTIEEAARVYTAGKPSSILYGMGITQHSHGTDNVMALANLAMMTGNVGVESGGVNPIRGQNNVQGACDMGALPNVYPGYQKVDDPDSQKKFEMAWQTDLSASPGLTHTEIIDAMIDGRVETLYLVGENPLITEANAEHVREALEKVKFLIVQDIFLTETAEYADVVLPAASFAEQDGTFTNSERRVQRVRKAIEPLGDSKPDWVITSELAQRMGADGFEFGSAEEIMQEVASLSPIYAGISYVRLENESLQWPCRDENDPGTKFLHQEKFARPNGKGKFIPLIYKPSAEQTDQDYPLIMTTDRSVFHYASASMTKRVAGMHVLNGIETVKINPIDAEVLGIVDGDKVWVASRRGKVEIFVKVTDVMKPGVVSMTYHSVNTPTNIITNPALDPIAKIPETQVTAVRIEKIN